MRDMGASLASENVERVLTGANTLELRMEKHQQNAEAISTFSF